jgi:fido (protein-threonine AMPylation protein)
MATSLNAHGDHRDYTDAEQQQLTANLVLVTGEIHGGQWNARDVSPQTLCELHRRLFLGVRDHAGRPRCKGWGAEHLVFGPNRSHHRDDVANALERVFQEARRSIRSLLANPDDPNYEHCAIHVAAWLNAQVIRIHPFEDGNGRSSRLLMAKVLVELGMQPIPLEATKQEYTNLLNTYFRNDQMQPLVDLLLRLADPG